MQVFISFAQVAVARQGSKRATRFKNLLRILSRRSVQVFISFAQVAVARQGSEERNMWNWLNPKEGGSSMAYAWDEPNLDHKMRVQVHFVSWLLVSSAAGDGALQL